MLPVATAIQRGAPKIYACVLCVREGHVYEVFLVLAKTRLIFPRINGPNIWLFKGAWARFACILNALPLFKSFYVSHAIKALRARVKEERGRD